MLNLRNIDLVMDTTVRFTNEIPRIIQEIITEFLQEKVVLYDLDGDRQLFLCALKVEYDVQLLQEVGDRIAILVFFQLDHFDDLLEYVANS